MKTNNPARAHCAARVVIGWGLLINGCSSLRPTPPPSTYSALLADDKIAPSIIWEGEHEAAAYPSWSQEEKEALARAIDAREAGRPAGLTEPPARIESARTPKIGFEIRRSLIAGPQKCENADALDPDSEEEVFISAGDAWKLYLAHVAHSLWLERGRKVAWSLRGMTSFERALLLDSRRLMERRRDGRYRISRYLMGHALSWDPAIPYRFLNENGMIGDTPEKTVLALAGWANHNLIHIGGDENFKTLYGYKGPPPIERILYKHRPGRQIVLGCWGVTGFFAAALRGVNIPVESAVFDRYHSRPIFPTAGRALHHGDDIYTALVTPTGNAVPPERILLTRDEFKRLVDSPDLDCAAGRCNTLEEQARYNISRRTWLMVRDFLPDYPLSEYAVGGPALLDEVMRGYSTDNRFVTFAKPFLSDTERAAMIAAVEAELRRLGGGDIEKGKTLASRRIRDHYRR